MTKQKVAIDIANIHMQTRPGAFTVLTVNLAASVGFITRAMHLLNNTTSLSSCSDVNQSFYNTLSKSAP